DQLIRGGFDKSSWPGLREGKAVSNLALSRNPRFLFVQANRPSGSSLEEELQKLSLRIPRDEDAARQSLLQLGYDVFQKKAVPDGVNARVFHFSWFYALSLQFRVRPMINYTIVGLSMGAALVMGRELKVNADTVVLIYAITVAIGYLSAALVLIF